MPIYSLEDLRRHTAAIRAANEPVFAEHLSSLTEAIERFDEFFLGLDSESNRVSANVRKLLSTKFVNHWYSALLLCEAGLMADAILCERSALETLAYHWLVCLDPGSAEHYHTGTMPKPYQVRRRLEALGVDIAFVRESYAFGSEIGHVGRKSERFHLRWNEEGDGTLLLGGCFSKPDSEHWIEWLQALMFLFQHPLMTTPPSDTPDSRTSLSD